jgi:hypothetical protein
MKSVILFLADVQIKRLWDSLLLCAALAVGFSATASAQMWGPPATLSPVPISAFAGPVVDSLGNSWVLINDGVNLSVVESNGASGTWLTPHVLGPWIIQVPATLAVDQSGGVYVVYEGAQNPQVGPFPLMWAKYTPASGWQVPSVAYSSPEYFDTVIPAVDSAGHLVVIFNPSGAIASIVYNPATSSWGRVQTIASANENVLLPSMAGNASGSRLALIYLGLRGLEYSFFNSSTVKWSASAPVSGGSKATFDGASAGSLFPITVDASGNVTAVVPLKSGHNQWTIGGFRYEGGAWQATELEPPSPSVADLEDFGSIALSPSGAVLVAVPYNATGSPPLTIAVFRYTPGTGWDTETAATEGDSLASRCRIAWFESSGAVMVFHSDVGESVALYSNGAWASGPSLPDGYVTNFSLFGMTTAPNGDALLVMNAISGETSVGTVATWLMP